MKRFIPSCISTQISETVDDDDDAATQLSQETPDQHPQQSPESAASSSDGSASSTSAAAAGKNGQNLAGSRSSLNKGVKDIPNKKWARKALSIEPEKVVKTNAKISYF